MARSNRHDELDRARRRGEFSRLYRRLRQLGVPTKVTAEYVGCSVGALRNYGTSRARYSPSWSVVSRVQTLWRIARYAAVVSALREALDVPIADAAERAGLKASFAKRVLANEALEDAEAAEDALFRLHLAVLEIRAHELNRRYAAETVVTVARLRDDLSALDADRAVCLRSGQSIFTNVEACRAYRLDGEYFQRQSDAELPVGAEPVIVLRRREEA